MSNTQMKDGRFQQWAQNRAQLRWIQSELQSGKTIVVATYTKATQFTAKHVTMFKATKSGLYVQRGKSWDCIANGSINLCSIRSYSV